MKTLWQPAEVTPCQREPHPGSVKKSSTLKTKHWTCGWQHRLLRRPETKQLITAGVNYWGTSKERPWKGMRKLIPTWNNMSNVRCWRRKTFDFSLRSVISWSLQITKVAPPVSRLSVVQKATTFYDWFAHRHSHFPKCLGFLKPLREKYWMISKMKSSCIHYTYNFVLLGCLLVFGHIGLDLFLKRTTGKVVMLQSLYDC